LATRLFPAPRPLDEDRGRVVGGHTRQDLEDALKGLALADQVVVAVALLVLVDDLLEFPAQAAYLQGRLDDGDNGPGLHRPVDEVEGTQRKGPAGRFDVAVGGHHDDGRIGLALPQALKDIDPVHVRKPHGQQHEIEVPPVGRREAFGAAAGRDHVVPFVDQGKAELLADGVLLARDENFLHGTGSSGILQEREGFLRPPGGAFGRSPGEGEFFLRSPG
jgi:hypothetical protein